MEGLEPTSREALDPKSSVSTNFTTSAIEGRMNFTHKKQECKSKKLIDFNKVHGFENSIGYICKSSLTSVNSSTLKEMNYI